MTSHNELAMVLASVRANQDDQDAWRSAYLAMRRPVLGYLYMLGFKEAADREDLASEVFFRFLAYSPWRRDWSTLPSAPVVTAYLRKTAQNVAYTATRNRLRQESIVEEVGAEVSVSSLLDSGGDSLSQQEQAFIAAYVASGYSLIRLAQSRKASYSAVATQLHRIRKKIRESIRNR